MLPSTLTDTTSTKLPATQAGSHPSNPAISRAGDHLTIQFASGDSARFHASWLRLNAPNPLTTEPHTGCRTIAISDVPAEATIRSAQLQADHLHLTFGPDSHHAAIPLPWLARHVYDTPTTRDQGWLPPHIQLLTAATALSHITARYDDLLSNDDALLGWLQAINTYGVGRFTHAPAHEDALGRLTNRFATARYTPAALGFTTQSTSHKANNQANNLRRVPHTKAAYRTPVPTMSAVLCTENSTDGHDTLVVDGYHAAATMRETHGLSFDLLTDYTARFSYRTSPSTELHSQHPVIAVAPGGQLDRVTFSPSVMGPVTDVPFQHLPNYNQAYRDFHDIVIDEAMQLRFRLDPGDGYVTDNTRMLTGNAAYTPGSGHVTTHTSFPEVDMMRARLAALQRSV